MAKEAVSALEENSDWNSAIAATSLNGVDIQRRCRRYQQHHHRRPWRTSELNHGPGQQATHHPQPRRIIPQSHLANISNNRRPTGAAVILTTLGYLQIIINLATEIYEEVTTPHFSHYHSGLAVGRMPAQP